MAITFFDISTINTLSHYIITFRKDNNRENNTSYVPIKSSAENASASQTCSVNLEGTFSSDSSHEKKFAYDEIQINIICTETTLCE